MRETPTTGAVGPCGSGLRLEERCVGSRRTVRDRVADRHEGERGLRGGGAMKE